jgi:hypothetical protein
MAQGGVGYWGANHWHTNYWHVDYWVEGGVAGAAEEVGSYRYGWILSHRW